MAAQRVAALWDEWADEDPLDLLIGPLGDPLTVTYPTTPLGIKVRVALGADLSASPATWSWTDITTSLRFDLGINIQSGMREGSSTVTTGQGSLKLDNRGGTFSRRNPLSAYYGLLSKNTPIWVTVDAGSGEKDRMQMFVNEWPVRWSDPSATDSTVTIQCAGIMRRLAQGRVLKSALRRAVLNSGPAAYWPMEDGSETDIVGSALPGGDHLGVNGTVNFATADGPAGSLPLPSSMLDLDGELTGRGPGTSTTSWGVSFVVSFPPDNFPTDEILGSIASWTVPGHSLFARFRLATFFGEGVGFGLSGYDYSGAEFTIIGGLNSTDITRDVYHHIMIWQEQSGSNIVTTWWYDGVQISSDTRAGTNGTVGIGQLTISPELDEFAIAANAANVSLGHWAIYDSAISTTAALAAAAQTLAMNGYVGEMAHVRMARLAAEEGMLFECLASVSAQMGAQGVDTLLGLFRAAEAADGGRLYEKRWGLAYRSLAELQNQTVALALDVRAGHIANLPEPPDDDQRTRNLWRVSRTDGSEATVEETTGPMGTGSLGPGLYDDSTQLNLYTDSQLPQQAGWRVHLGTVDEDRWPQLGMNFTRNPSLIDSWTALPYGARATVANPLLQMGPNALDLIIDGHSERIDPKLWVAAMNASPSIAYQVHVVGSTDGNLGRVDAANSTLAADATDVATTISVASSGALWRTGTVSFDINVAGERMTVTNISGASSPQTFTVTRSVNAVTKAQPALVGGRSVKVSLWRPAAYALISVH